VNVESQIRVEVVDGKTRYDGRTLAEWVPNMVDDIVRALDPLQIILFGSVARGDDTRDSDVDLLIIVPHIERGTKADRRLEARRAVGAPVPMDLLVIDAAELGERGDLPGILRVACREGKVLYARPA
jgi:predicted nucleotidyltransferase